MKIAWICSTIPYLCNPANKLAYLYDLSPVEQIHESHSRKRWHHSSGHRHTRNVTLSSSEALSLITVRIFVRDRGIHLRVFSRSSGGRVGLGTALSPPNQTSVTSDVLHVTVTICHTQVSLAREYGGSS